MHRFSIDFLSKELPKTKEGYRFLLVMIDCFSRYVFAVPMKTKERGELANVLLKTFYENGFPRIIHSDNERALIADTLNIIWAKMGIRRTKTLVRNPQANPVERVNSFFHNMFTMNLRKYENWPEILPLICFAYRVARNATTGYSPFFLMHGRDPILPLHLTVSKPDLKGENPSISAEEAKEHLDAIWDVFDQVRQRQLAVAERNAARINEGRKSAHFFKKGDQVLVFKKDKTSASCPARDPSAKTKKAPFKWTFPASGPHVVVGVGDYETVLIEDSNSKIRQYVKAKHLKLHSLFNDPQHTPLVPYGEPVTRPEEGMEPITKEKPTLTPGEICVVHFPKCSEEPYMVAKYLGRKETPDWGEYDLFHWYGQYPSRTKPRPIPLKTRTWWPAWYDGKLTYWSKSPQHWRDVEYTNDITWEFINPDQIVSHGFTLTKQGKLPPFILEKVSDHEQRLEKKKLKTRRKKDTSETENEEPEGNGPMEQKNT